MKIERREYMERLYAWRDKQIIKVITGVRRCGKSFLLEMHQEWLRAQGFYNVRLRVHGAIARIEVDPESMSELVAMREDVLREMAKCGFDYITVDLAGFRSGSMDIHIDKT